MNAFFTTLPGGALLFLLLLPATALAAPHSFEADGTNGFTFDTGLLRGRLRADGQSKGLTAVVHKPSGTRLDRGMGLLGHYRLFGDGRRYEDGWQLPSEAALQPDGCVQANWPPAPQRPFALSATYRIVASNVFEVETVVTARAKVAAFESFLASYHAPEFTNCLVLAHDEASAGTQRFIPAEETRGTWLVFPRDRAAMRLVRDGRWTIAPNPVDWVEQPRFVAPLAVRRAANPAITTATMSGPENCFAVLTPHQTETHYSVYLSQFGRDLEPGETQTNRARLVVLERGSEKDAEQAYRAWRQGR